MIQEELRQEEQRLPVPNSRPTTRRVGRLTLKVGAKGGISVYGLWRRFPVSLYKDQWLTLLDIADDIRAFIKDHEDKLASRHASPVEKSW